MINNDFDELATEDHASAVIDWTDSGATKEQFQAFVDAKNLIIDMLADRIIENV